MLNFRIETRKMKTMVALLAVTLLFVKCSKNEVSSVNDPNADAIGFDISTGKTRANVIDLGALQLEANGFGVYATNGASSNLFIDNKAYKYEGGKWKWAELNMLWPKEDINFPINFYAYYPQASTKLNSTLTAKYTVAATPETQVDLLAANQVGVGYKPISGNVTLTFRHMLSKIDFKVVTGSKITVEVQSIAVRNVGNAGTFNFANLAWTAPPNAWNSGFSYMTAQAPKSINKFVNQTIAKDVAGSSGSLMLMPQDLKNQAWNKTLAGLSTQSYIEVVYRVYETDGGKDVVGFSDATKHPDYADLGNGVTGPLFVKVGYPLPTEWQMGKAYAYTIYIDGISSGGNLIEENFIDENGEETDLPVVDPETGEPIEPPGPIFPDKDEIGFVVSVENWGEPAVDIPLD